MNVLYLPSCSKTVTVLGAKDVKKVDCEQKAISYRKILNFKLFHSGL